MILPYRVPRKFARTAGSFAKSALAMYRPGATRLYRPLASYVMNNRASIMRGAAKFLRAGHARWKAKQRRNIGDTIGTTSCQRVTQLNEKYSQSTRILSWSLLNLVAEGTGNAQRLRDTVNLRGFVIQANITSKFPDKILHFNWAVISPKNDLDVLVNTNFFRSYEDRRAQNFGDTDLSVVDYKLRPINTDKYNVLAHQRFTLSAADGQDGRGYMRMIRKWIPLKRQLRFDTDTEERSYDKIFFVTWCDINNTDTGASVANAVDIIVHNVAYWRNTRH